MREILFRGKRVFDDTWVYGFLFITRKGKYNIKWYDPHFGSSNTSEVYPESVGQFTELKDKNGKRIFEGDIVRYVYEPGKGFWNANQLSVIEHKGTGFHMEGIKGTNKYACMSGWLISIPFDQEAECIPEFEVIGNIHDNPEFLEVTPRGPLDN